MDLHLSHLDPAESLRIFLDGALVCTVAVNQAQDTMHLAQQVREATVYQRLAWLIREWHQLVLADMSGEDHIHTTASARQEAFGRGMAGGLAEQTIPHPFPGVPAIPPDQTPSYRRGYEYGTTLARCMAVLDAAKETV